jgi:hypothetical protein
MTEALGVSAKCAFLGDDDSGKVELFYVLNAGAEIKHDTIEITNTFDEMLTILHLWNVHFQNTKSARGQIRFSKADLFVVCFNIHNRQSFEDINIIWAPILKKNPTIPVVIFGINTLPLPYAIISPRSVNLPEIEALQTELGAEEYIEFEILQSESIVDKIFDDLANVFYHKQRVLQEDGTMKAVMTPRHRANSLTGKKKNTLDGGIHDKLNRLKSRDEGVEMLEIECDHNDKHEIKTENNHNKNSSQNPPTVVS